MILIRVFIAMILALAVLFLGAAAAADRVERSTDEQGTIHIGVKPPAKQEKAGTVIPYDPVTGTGTPPGMVPPTSRRGRGGPDESVRQKAFEKSHPDMVESLRDAEKRQQAASEAAAVQPGQPPASESDKGEQGQD